MFIDSVKFSVKAGKGGAGAKSFRREKYVPLGGPDGGDGGDGGNVYFLVDNNTHALAHYRGKKYFKAKNGEPGGGKGMTGKNGEDLVLKVPPGTQVLDENGTILLDLVESDQKVLFLKGGKGGLGNARFKNSTNQAPNYAQPGLDGESKNISLELKLIGDVGLVGFPNVGKSTLISTVSNARPQIANYEFTTLSPKLGMVEIDEFSSFIMADIPGIIEGASDGRGLGVQFLRHIERNKILLFVLDIVNHRDLKEQFITLKDEISKFSSSLSEKPFAIIFTKSEICESLDEIYSAFLSEFGFEKKQNIDIYNKFDTKKPYFVLPISSAANLNIDKLKNYLLEMLKILD